MLTRFKFKARPHYVANTQPDGEEEVPRSLRDCPSYLGKDVLSRADSSDVSFDFIVDGLNAGESSENRAVGSGGGEWLDPIPSKKKKNQQALRETLTSMSTSRKKKCCIIKQGTYVSTTDDRISDLPDVPIIPGQRRKRPVCYGTVVKPSHFYDKVWLVKFDDGRSFMCASEVLKFVSKVSPTYKIEKGKDGLLGVAKLRESVRKEREVILSTILNSKIHRTAGCNDITYDRLVALFKPQHTWLMSSKLRKYVSISRKSTCVNSQQESIKPGTWLTELPTEDINSNDKEIEKSPQKSSFNQNSSSSSDDSSNATGHNHKDNSYNSYDSPSDSYLIVKDTDHATHGVACSCCSVREKYLYLTTMTDTGHMFKHKEKTGKHHMITEIGVDKGVRYVRVKPVNLDPMYDDDEGFVRIDIGT